MNTSTEVTRRAILDELRVLNCSWAGGLHEDDFLSRLYDLTTLPSDDYRHESAAGDIWQHRVMNRDWDDFWVFSDARFDLLRCQDAGFLRFLSETVHPVVRPNTDDACGLVEKFNEHLGRDGWKLIQQREISGKPVFAPQPTSGGPELFDEPTGWPKVDRQLSEVRLRLSDATSEERYQAVGHLCRETLISLAQAVYVRERHLPVDGVHPSCTDAKRMLEAYIAVELHGGTNATARKHAKAALDLANELQHDRSAAFRDAALCAEATLSVIRLVTILAGRRERIGLC